MVIGAKSVHSKPVAIAEEFDDDEEDVSVEIMMESDNNIVAEKEQIHQQHLRSAECCSKAMQLPTEMNPYLLHPTTTEFKLVANPNIEEADCQAFESRLLEWRITWRRRDGN